MTLDLEGDLAVLGALLLDDVELGQDLDPAHQAGGQVGRQFGDLAQDAVDAGPDPEARGVRLEVQVAGSVAQRLGDEQVDDLDDRCGLECLDLRGRRVRHLGGDDRSRAGEGRDLGRQVADAIAMADRVVDLRTQREPGDDRSADEIRDFFKHRLVAWVVGRDDEVLVLPTGEGEGHHPETPGVRLGQRVHRSFIARAFTQVDQGRVQLDREDRGEGDLVDHPVLAQDLAEALASFALGAEGVEELRVGHETCPQQQIAQPR